MSKHENDKRIVLIATMGSSPAVLTETVWALAHMKKPIVPDEIVVLSARNSVDKMKRDLLEGLPAAAVKSDEFRLGHPLGQVHHPLFVYVSQIDSDDVLVVRFL